MLDMAGFELALAKLADRGQAPPLPARVQANEATIPLALVDTGKELLAGPLLRPQFGVPMPVLRQRAPAFTLVADAPAQCDLGDGAGAHELAPGATTTAAYPPGSAEATITLRRNEDIATSRLAISDAPAPRPQETWPLPGGSASVLLAAGHDALRAPLVAVEGFPGGHGFLFSHDVLAQHGLLAELQARGYDLVVVGLQDGKRSLRANAEVVCACLREVAKRTELPVTLLGWSMGGLLARIALAQMATQASCGCGRWGQAMNRWRAAV